MVRCTFTAGIRRWLPPDYVVSLHYLQQVEEVKQHNPPPHPFLCPAKETKAGSQQAVNKAVFDRMDASASRCSLADSVSHTLAFGQGSLFVHTQQKENDCRYVAEEKPGS